MHKASGSFAYDGCDLAASKGSFEVVYGYIFMLSSERPRMRKTWAAKFPRRRRTTAEQRHCHLLSADQGIFRKRFFSLRSIDPRRISFKKGSLRLQLTHFKSANGFIRPNGIGIEKCIESGCRCNEVDIRQQEDGHVFDDKLRHVADAEKAEFF